MYFRLGIKHLEQTIGPPKSLEILVSLLLNLESRSVELEGEWVPSQDGDVG